LASTGEVLTAYIDPQGRLAVSVIRREGDPTRIEISSANKPSLVGIDGDSSFQSLGDSHWQLTLGAPSLPAQVELSEGWTFHIGARTQKTAIDVHYGWEKQGFPGFSGAGNYECSFSLPEAYPAFDWELVFDRVETALEVYLNGELVGSRAWPPYTLILPKSRLTTSGNRLEVRVSNTAGNRYYHNTPFGGSDPTPSGIIGPPQIRPVSILQITA
jgi:hypothetical protein